MSIGLPLNSILIAPSCGSLVSVIFIPAIILILVDKFFFTISGTSAYEISSPSTLILTFNTSGVGSKWISDALLLNESVIISLTKSTIGVLS